MVWFEHPEFWHHGKRLEVISWCNIFKDDFPTHYRFGSTKKWGETNTEHSTSLNNMNKLQQNTKLTWSPIRFFSLSQALLHWEASGILLRGFRYTSNKSFPRCGTERSGACSGWSRSDSGSLLFASGIQATAGLHWWAAAFLHTTSAGSTLVIADALVHALVTRALHQVSHTGGTAIRVTLTGHAALGAREACSTGAATVVQCTVKGPPSTMLPHT